MFTTAVSALFIAGNIFFAQPVTVVNDRALIAQERQEERQETREEDRMEAMEQREEERQERVEEREEKREEFRQHLQEIKDERKAKILERLQEKFGNLQERWGEHWKSALERLEEILAKIEERGGTTAEVTAAKTAITDASTAIDGFLSNKYFIEIDTEENVGQNVRSLLDEYKADARDVFETVKDAKDAVRKSAQAASPDDTEETTTETNEE